MNKADIETRNYALIIFATGVAGGICQCISSIAFSKSGEALTMRMRIISFASILRQEIGWFDREENKIGALVTQLSSDTSNLKVTFTNFICPNKKYFLLGFIRYPNGYYF
jgi:ATP-binding cassette subfamily B (MDR/TAP) protein 1